MSANYSFQPSALQGVGVFAPIRFLCATLGDAQTVAQTLANLFRTPVDLLDGTSATAGVVLTRFVVTSTTLTAPGTPLAPPNA